MRWFDQLFCVHWFGKAKITTFEESYGAFICFEQKADDVTYETRTCLKCGFSERREVSRRYLGWR